MAYVRTKQIKGKTYRYLVKSVREGKRVRQVFVAYIGNPTPPSSTTRRGAASDTTTDCQVICWPDFTPLNQADLRMPYTMLLRQLGCQSVVFNLRARYKHGETQAQRYVNMGQVVITKVRLHREASAHVMAHEVGHVIDYLLQNAQDGGGSTNADFRSHSQSLCRLADYTCTHHVGSSPDYVRCLKGGPTSKAHRQAVRKLERYYQTYVYQPAELFARLVAVSFTEPDKAKAIAPAAYAWLQATLYPHQRIRAALIDIGLWCGEESTRV